jgi:heparan-alpha-glucosaminide N-acetyltransferase
MGHPPLTETLLMEILRDINPAISSDPSRIQSHVQSRVHSIDIFRGLTVLLMVFVDNLGFVKGLPWWTYHMPREANGMTYVDMVFPAFLFLVGMSIPLAIQRRIARGDSPAKVWTHIIVRSVGLLVLGLFISNAPQIDGEKTGISAVAWALLGFAAIVLVWNVAPSSVNAESSQYKTLRRVLKLAGLALLLTLAIIFKRTTPEGRVAWLDFSDWEILGLIGWAYLLVSTVYFVFRKNIWVLLAAFVALVTTNSLSTAGWLHGLDRFPGYVRPFEAGLASITMAGVLTAMIFLEDTIASTFKAKALWALGYAAVLAAAAWMLTPLGISKLRDTPAWCLYCSAANILIVLLLYWIADENQKTKWARFTKPAGVNPLLAYLLAYIAYFTPRLGVLTADGSSGWPGVGKSLFFTGLVLTVSAILTRWRIRLQL